MADLIDHIHQANHNLACSKKFLSDSSCRDWAITAAFYSAVHFAEAGFAATEIQHSETKRPKDEEPHGYRSRMVKKKFGNTCWQSYRKLSEASYHVRYLALWESKRGGALSYYNQDDAQTFVNRDLTTVRDEIQSKSGINLK